MSGLWYINFFWQPGSNLCSANASCKTEVSSGTSCIDGRPQCVHLYLVGFKSSVLHPLQMLSSLCVGQMAYHLPTPIHGPSMAAAAAYCVSDDTRYSSLVIQSSGPAGTQCFLCRTAARASFWSQRCGGICKPATWQSRLLPAEQPRHRRSLRS